MKHSMNQQKLRESVLGDYGASILEIEELLAYNQNVFRSSCLKLPVKFPLSSEMHISTWEGYAAEAKVVGTFEVLKQRLVQLQFPILKGVSQTEAYRYATRKGIPVNGMSEATGLILKQPEKLQLMLYQSLAGTIPVLLTNNRDDFVSLLQALAMRNEPLPVPASMGACAIAGFNNWDRIHSYRQQWQNLRIDRKTGMCV